MIALYLSSRLANLKIIPIFTDEAIYAYWAQVALHDPANRFISLEDGKQPLFIWLAAIAQKFVSDPLVADRLISVLAGLGSLFGIYFLASQLFTRRVAMISAFLYIVLPFSLLYDRMGLFDSLLTMLGIWSVFFAVRLAQKIQLDNALLAGAALGLAVVTKSSGIFFLYFLPLSLLFFDFKNKRLKSRFLRWAGLAAIAVFISLAIYNSLRLSPLFYMIARKNLEFIRTPAEILADPFLNLISNAKTLSLWSIEYIGLPLFIMLLAAIILAFYRRNLAAIYFSIIVFASFAAESLVNKVIYPRFLLFYFPFAIILIAYVFNLAIEHIGRISRVIYIVLALFLLNPAVNSLRLLTDPSSAKIADADMGQYLNNWPAGWGVSEIVNFLKSHPQTEKVYVGTEGTFGLLPYAFLIYFYANPSIQAIGYWPVDPTNLPAQILELAKDHKTYFVFNENQKEIVNSHLKFLAKYQKGQGNSFMRLYQVIP